MPIESTQTELGEERVANVAGPLSPESPSTFVPAKRLTSLNIKVKIGRFVGLVEGFLLVGAVVGYLVRVGTREGRKLGEEVRVGARLGLERRREFLFPLIRLKIWKNNNNLRKK